MLALLLLSLFVWRVTDLGDLLSFSKKKKKMSSFCAEKFPYSLLLLSIIWNIMFLQYHE